MSERLITEIPEAVREETIHRVLAFDPTPAGLVADRSLRKAFKYQWKQIRARHFKENGTACTLCHVVEPAQNKIDGHEVYSFPNREIVRLERILFVCKRCHDAVHLQRTRSYGSPAYIRVIEEHYCKVNGGISENELNADYANSIARMLAIREFYGGGGATPKIDFGDYQSGIDATLKRKRTRQSDDDDEDEDDGFEMYPGHDDPWDLADELSATITERAQRGRR